MLVSIILGYQDLQNVILLEKFGFQQKLTTSGFQRFICRVKIISRQVLKVGKLETYREDVKLNLKHCVKKYSFLDIDLFVSRINT